MTWTEIERADTLEAVLFNDVVAQCADYAGVGDDFLEGLLKRGCKVFLYTSAEFNMVLGFSIEDGKANIKVGVPSPSGSARKHCEVMIQKLREELDPIGITEWFALQQDLYKSEHMFLFSDHIDRVCHEFVSEVRSGNSRKIRFQRLSDNKIFDNVFVGPGHKRPEEKWKDGV